MSQLVKWISECIFAIEKELSCEDEEAQNQRRKYDVELAKN
jgi:hypothetical protein